MGSVTVVIPNYNGMKFLGPCLDSLRKQTMKEFDIIVVDDASEDGSVDYIRENYPEVKVIERESNGGFCRTANTGVRAASSDYVLLLNNDTVAEPGFVEGLYSGISGNEKIFSCSACMLRAGEPEILDGAGDLYNIIGWAFARGQGRPAAEYESPANVFSSCGGAAIYNRRLFIELGMLDEEHISYLEDLDIGYRARINGYRNMYIPSAKVLHVGSGTYGARHTPFKVKVSARNNVYIIYKNMPLAQFIFNCPFLFAGFLLKYMYFRKKGFGKEYSEGISEGLALKNRKKGTGVKQKLSFKRVPFFFSIQMQLWANLFKRRG